jgi:hypothetical protein
MTERLQNQWLVRNNTVVQNIKRLLVEYGYRGQDDLPAKTIIGVLESSIFEIHRLQKELDSLNEKFKELSEKKAPKKKEAEKK